MCQEGASSGLNVSATFPKWICYVLGPGMVNCEFVGLLFSSDSVPKVHIATPSMIWHFNKGKAIAHGGPHSYRPHILKHSQGIIYKTQETNAMLMRLMEISVFVTV